MMQKLQKKIKNYVIYKRERSEERGGEGEGEGEVREKDRKRERGERMGSLMLLISQLPVAEGSA